MPATSIERKWRRMFFTSNDSRGNSRRNSTSKPICKRNCCSCCLTNPEIYFEAPKTHIEPTEKHRGITLMTSEL
ncbi:hypothetical protein NC653_030102 [Populus alba x Populus x berolinensis]|uniref:Uncharacterized protein n=1 Tax=Populus alba x Populus x berolinensis TaxID=444605 RepID=A0AAD6Q157_9ROSI|nr:hypothetical protein NC653_030102 [Populus alba x Populus x berolinensis]